MPRPIHREPPVIPSTPTTTIQRPASASPLLGTHDFSKVPLLVQNRERMNSKPGTWIPPKHGVYKLDKWAMFARGNSQNLISK